MADHHRAEFSPAQDIAEVASDLALATAGADCAYRDDGNMGPEHGPLRAKKGEVRPCCQGDRGVVSENLVGDVTIGEDDLVNPVKADELRETLFCNDGDALGIKEAGKRRGIYLLLDPWDLRGGESDNAHRGIVPKCHVEVVKIPSPGTHYHDPSWAFVFLHPLILSNSNYLSCILTSP
jgi:hypothetical protein